MSMAGRDCEVALSGREVFFCLWCSIRRCIVGPTAQAQGGMEAGVATAHCTHLSRAACRSVTHPASDASDKARQMHSGLRVCSVLTIDSSVAQSPLHSPSRLAAL